MNMGNKYWLTHPDCEKGIMLLTCLSILETAQEVGKRYGDKTQISFMDDNKLKRSWVLNGTWKEMNFLP